MDIQATIKELKTRMTFKEHTTEGDLILIVTTEGCAYGIVRNIAPDAKKGWWQMHFALLSIPPATVTWILRASQMDGELFTMDGNEQIIMPVSLDEPDTSPPHAGLRLVR